MSSRLDINRRMSKYSADNVVYNTLDLLPQELDQFSDLIIDEGVNTIFIYNFSHPQLTLPNSATIIVLSHSPIPNLTLPDSSHRFIRTFLINNKTNVSNLHEYINKTHKNTDINYCNSQEDISCIVCDRQLKSETYTNKDVHICMSKRFTDGTDAYRHQFKKLFFLK